MEWFSFPAVGAIGTLVDANRDGAVTVARDDAEEVAT